MSVKRVALVLALVTAAGTVAGCGGSDRGRFAPALKQQASATPRWVRRDKVGARLWALEKRFYAERQFVPAWIDGDDPTAQLDELLASLRDAELHGLNPASYDYDALAAARAKADEPWIGTAFDPKTIPELDLHLTYAFLLHASDLLGWRSSRQLDSRWLPAPKKADLIASLRTALEGNDVRETLEGLAPAHPQYKGLQAALAHTRKGAANVDADRVRMNLERWRWMPRDFGDAHILVNVPAYQLQVIDDGSPVLSMRVIVGAPDTPTPLFSDDMTYVVFSPYWNIPESIIREETLPRLAEDPDYLGRNNIEVVDASGEPVDASDVDWADESAAKELRFRQAPGPENALGLVKFIFPNHFSVYLHDTPTENLFNNERRALSHGCVRVESPVALAEYVLHDKAQWTPERIRGAMVGEREQAVRLRKPIPVHIGYWTAWVASDGSVAYFDDPYGLDKQQARAAARITRR
jgi:murein L,D-transpeptidase YcbB/YkuD